MNDKSKEEIKKVLYESEVVETKFYTLKDMKVTMLDWPNNPYPSLVDMAMQTWRSGSRKWSRLSPETRFEVVKLIMQKKVLPLAAEEPNFSFQVDRCSRAFFDQAARTRVGIVFSSAGQKDDNLHSIGFVLPSAILGTKYEEIIKNKVIEAKELYNDMYKSGIPNWSLRCILPMYVEHNFMFAANLTAIQNLLSKRMETTEMEECVGFSILVREAIKEKFPIFAEYLRPSCDWTKKDMTGPYNGFSSIIGVPHKSDMRHPGYNEIECPAKWDSPCTDIGLVEKMIGYHLPHPNEWIDFTWDTIPDIEKERFIK
jgi:thymidylate synthase ThyX